MTDKSGIVVSKPDTTTEVLDTFGLINDSVGVDAALDEALDLQDAIVVSVTEKTGQVKDPQSRTGNSKDYEYNLKEIREERENVHGVLNEKIADANPGEVGAERIIDENETETGTMGEKNIVEDKTATREEETTGKIAGKMDDAREATKYIEAEMTGLAETIDPKVSKQSQMGRETLSESAKEKVEPVAEVTAGSTEVELAIEVIEAVEAVKAISQSVEKQQGEEVLENNSKETFPTSAVNVEKCILVESRPENEAQKVNLVRAAPPKVPLLPNKPAENVEGEAAIKPCDRITKDMVPIMKEGRVEEVLKLSDQIEFHKGVTPLALLSKSRWLVRQADVTRVPHKESAMSFFRSLRRTTYHIFLFNDTFLICKKKGGSSFVALNYCQRNLVLMSKASSADRLPEKIRKDTPRKSKVYLTLLENHEKKAENMVLSFTNSLDRDEWIKLFKTPASSNDQEVVFELWDCPLVKVVHDYEATKPEEMTVRKDEKINVIRKCSNGFYEGERLQDLQRGFFPISATVELSSEHSRANQIRNIHNDTTF